MYEALSRLSYTSMVSVFYKMVQLHLTVEAPEINHIMRGIVIQALVEMAVKEAKYPPDVLLPSQVLQLLLGDLTMFPGQEYVSIQCGLWSPSWTWSS